MSKVNTVAIGEKRVTHEGAPANQITNYQEFRRSVLTNMLWEDTHYESGEDVSKRIARLIPLVKPELVAQTAIEARDKQYLRHVPLYIVAEMTKYDTHKGLVSETLEHIIQRPDELTEYLALYWKEGKRPISNQSKKGLAAAFHKFNEYSLAKYDRDTVVKLEDVLFLAHPKPRDQAEDALWKKLIAGTLETPDTWEVQLSKAHTPAEKKEVWEGLMQRKVLGGFAFIRNLRNMTQVKVDEKMIRDYSQTVSLAKILPFRFFAAAKAAPEFEDICDEMLLRACAGMPKLPGTTELVVDVSGSMYGTNVSSNSDMNRAHAACVLASIAREVCEHAVVYATAGNDSTQIHKTQKVPARRGMALVDAIYDLTRPLGGGGIFITPVFRYLTEQEGHVDRTITITDEQDCARSNKADSPLLAEPNGDRNYLINVNVYKNGVSYDKRWTRIDGWSENVFAFLDQWEQAGF